MKKIITLTITTICCFLLQTTIFQSLKLANISPNILLILVVSIGFMRGRTEGVLVGFFAGLLLDILYGGYLGIYALVYMLIGYINGCFNHMFFADEVILPLGLVLGNDFLLNLCIYALYFLMRNRLDFLFYLRYTILPEMIYTIVVTLVLYKLLLAIDSWLKPNEKRST